MAEQERINETIALLDASSVTGWRTLADVEEALRAFPSSAKLWNLRGDLIQLDDEAEEHYTLENALESYQRAVELDGTYAEAFENIGYYYDVHEDDPDRAEAFFRRAIELEPRRSTFVGLARVLAQLGRRHEALELLSAERCPFCETEDVQALRSEIEDGLW